MVWSGGLANDAGDPKDDRGDDAGARSWEDDPEYRPRSGRSESKRSCSQFIGHESEHLFGSSRNRRKHEDRIGQATCERALGEGTGDDQGGEDEQTGDD